MATNMKSLNGYGFDASALGGKAPEYYVQPRNLLDNSDFTNLVAQAGIGGNHGTVAYAADRWALISGTVSYTAGTGLTLNGTITQKLENAPAAAYPYVGMVSGTASIIYADGAITITSSGGVIQWAALYTTEYTADTLPPYVPKGYTAELAECQRYYYQSYSDGSSSTRTSGMIVCEAITTSKATNVFFPQTMRIEKPTVTVYSPFSGNVDKASEYVSETEVVAKAGHRSGHRFMLQSDSSAFEIGKHYCIHYTASADL